MAKSEKELSTPEKREKKLKDYYKKLPLFKVKDILLGIKRKSQVYKDMGQKVPKNLISIQRSLYFIIKNKEEEQMEKSKLKPKDNSKLTIERIISIVSEGVDDPGILKCVFMAGGPGSGKSYTAAEIFGIDKRLKQSFSSMGLKTVNSDIAFEKLLKDNGINPKELAKIEKEDPKLWDKLTGKDSIRTRAKELTAKQKRLYETGRLGMIVDGTGHLYSKVLRDKERAESLGYDCYMVFVDTPLEVAKQRNLQRDRVLPEPLLVKSWKDVQDNLKNYKELFKDNLVVVDSSSSTPITKEIQKKVNRFIRKPIQNKIGQKWIKTARALKNANLIEDGKETLFELSEYAKNFLREVDRRKEIEANTQSQIDLFSEDINEDDLSTEKLQDVSRKIRKGDWEEMNPKAFRESLSKSKHSKMLTVYGVSDLAKMKLYKLNGYDIGFALKKNDGKYQEIVAVHNNEEGVSGIGKLLMNAAIKEGGCILDHFDSAILTNLYKALGFEETERYDYDPQYDPDQSFKNTYGELAVVYRKHKNCA